MNKNNYNENVQNRKIETVEYMVLDNKLKPGERA